MKVCGNIPFQRYYRNSQGSRFSGQHLYPTCMFLTRQYKSMTIITTPSTHSLCSISCVSMTEKKKHTWKLTPYIAFSCRLNEIVFSLIPTPIASILLCQKPCTDLLAPCNTESLEWDWHTLNNNSLIVIPGGLHFGQQRTSSSIGSSGPHVGTGGQGNFWQRESPPYNSVDKENVTFLMWWEANGHGPLNADIQWLVVVAYTKLSHAQHIYYDNGLTMQVQLMQVTGPFPGRVGFQLSPSP